MSNLKIFSAQLDKNISEIDLHTEQSLYSAIEKLDSELYSLYKSGVQYCRVVFGIGTGTLKQTTLQSLQKNPLVETMEMDENGGSIIVIFS
jgi:dsDNA-specific endonuclease/ATPase MutS2